MHRTCGGVPQAALHQIHPNNRSLLELEEEVHDHAQDLQEMHQAAVTKSDFESLNDTVTHLEYSFSDLAMHHVAVTKSDVDSLLSTCSRYEGREGGSERGRERAREGGKEGAREGVREGGRVVCSQFLICAGVPRS